LQLLYGNPGVYPSRSNKTIVYGTAFGISNSNRSAITNAVCLHGGYAEDEIELVPEVKCGKLLQDFSWQLSLATDR